MGIINVTPDSFSGDGVAGRPDESLRLAESHVAAGADMLDVGGESTRPGHQPVSLEEELERVVSSIQAIRQRIDAPISVDTTKAAVAEQALQAGAMVVNDISGLEKDPGMALLVRETGAGCVIMHSRTKRAQPEVVSEVLDFLREATGTALNRDIDRDQIVVDPGFGFAKNAEENLRLLARLSELRSLGFPILTGTSRKSTIGKVLDLPVEDRLEGTLATVALAIANGADVVRVHDVGPAVRVARMTDAVVRGWNEG